MTADTNYGFFGDALELEKAIRVSERQRIEQIAEAMIAQDPKTPHHCKDVILADPDQVLGWNVALRSLLDAIKHPTKL